MPALIIFVVLVVLIVLAALGWVLQIVSDAVATVTDFVINLPVVVVAAFGVAVLVIAFVVMIKTRDVWAFPFTVIGICLLAAVPILVIPPLVNGRQWNHDFECFYDGARGECDLDNRCIGAGDEFDPWGFCAAPFGGDYIGLAEFTQGQFKMHARGPLRAACDKIGARAGWDWSDKISCENAIDDRVAQVFDRSVSVDNCQYFDMPGGRKSPLIVADDAPMPCLSRDQAARICADMGGRLPTTAEYQSLFDGRQPSCANAVMAGAPEYRGLARHIKAREIRRFKAGPGCGRGRFSRVCEKYRTGNTPDGLCDVYGNLAEWTSDGGVMGGGFRSWPEGMLAETGAGVGQTATVADGPRIDVGFRCVIDGSRLIDPID